MTCKWGEKKNMAVLLAVGLVLLIGGIVFNLVLPEDAHMLSAHHRIFQRHGAARSSRLRWSCFSPQAAG